MKVTLGSRKNVRLNWFKQEGVPFVLKRELEFSYNENSVLVDTVTPPVYMQYSLSGLLKAIPKTNIIVFSEGLPHSYLSTLGSVGDKLLTEKVVDETMNVVDRIVKVQQGEESIITKPVPPNERHLFKEIQIHERQDTIRRKITLKNEGERLVKGIKVQFIEKKDINYSGASKEPLETDPPEYTWKVDVPPGKSVAIEIVLKRDVRQTYKIERDPIPQPKLKR